MPREGLTRVAGVPGALLLTCCADGGGCGASGEGECSGGVVGEAGPAGDGVGFGGEQWLAGVGLKTGASRISLRDRLRCGSAMKHKLA